MFFLFCCVLWCVVVLCVVLLVPFLPMRGWEGWYVAKRARAQDKQAYGADGLIPQTFVEAIEATVDTNGEGVALSGNVEDHGHSVGDIAAPNIDAPNIDAPNIDAPNIDAPKIDAPKIDAPKIDAPKIDEGASEPAAEKDACAAAGP
jgi:hypothetical protein